MKRKLLLAALCVVSALGFKANAETDYTSLMSSDWTGSTGNFGGGKERYQNANYTEGQKVMYQSFTAPASGIYEIKFYAVTSCTAARYAGSKYGDGIAQAYATAGSNSSTVAMTVINQTGCTLVEAGNIRTLSVEAAEGENIEYGLINIAEGGNWYTIKELSAKMKTVAEIFQDQYDEAYAIWENSTENEVGARATFKTYVDALYTAMSGTLADAQTASDNLAAQLVIYESKSYPVKGSGVKYDFTSKMDMAINAWTCAQGNGPAQYGYTGATETYGNTNAGKVMYQTISGLANGEYEIHFYAVANAANSGGVEGTKTIVYANDQENEIDVITQSSCTPSDYERTFTVIVTDGSIEYGFKNTVAAGNWYLCKNVALYMTGAPDLSDYYDAIAAKLVTANSLKSSPMKSTVLSALQDAIDATEGYTDITVIGTLETMSDNLTTAINNANTSVSNYEEASSILNAASSLDAAGQASYAANETVSAIQTAYDARTLESVTGEQATACAAALVTAAKAQTSAGADMTLAIANPNIDGNVDGWTIIMNNNGGYVGGPLKPSGDAMEFWAAGTQTEQDHGKSFDYYQDISSLPEGVYTITAQMLNSTNGETGANWNGGNTSGLYGKATGYEVQNLVTTNDETFREYTTDEIFVVDGNLRIGVKNIAPMTGRWFAATQFQLTYVRQLTNEDKAEIKSDLNDAITAASSARKAANEGTGIFQIPAAAGTSLATAISTAQGVYDNAGATLVQQTTAISNINAAKEIYEATTLNAPDADTRYVLTLAGKGALSFKTASTEGGYGMPFMTANVNLAQAFMFEAVSGNTYKMYFYDFDGNKRYICTRADYGEGGTGTYGIRTATDKSLNILIEATATADVFNMLNTACENRKLGSNGGDFYTDDAYTNWTIAEASQATVPVAAKAGKYGTIIFPFTPDVSSGFDNITFYSCNSVNGGESVEITEIVGDPVANTPYIIKNTSASDDFTKNVSGWGTAAALSYPDAENLLTGIYTAATIPANSYVLQTQDDVQKFYKLDVDATGVAYRAYLTTPSSAKVLRVVDGTASEVTAPEVVETEEPEVLYNMAGIQVDKNFKGVVVNQKGVKRFNR